jgi:hypothetical protein
VVIGDVQSYENTLDQSNSRHDEHDRAQAQQPQEEIDRLFDEKADPEHQQQEDDYGQGNSVGGDIAGKADLFKLGQQPKQACSSRPR